MGRHFINKDIERGRYPLIVYQDVIDARKRISPYIIHTPLLRAERLDAKLGCRAYIKPENLQVTGSFKIRGAANCILALSEDEKRRGIIATSSGNHAQGVACAAKLLGIDAVIIMPENCNSVKLANTKAYGAKVILAGTKSSERDEKAAELVETDGRTFIHPYANDFVKAGQGTIAAEILEDEPQMDVIVSPIGGGGLISGIATAAKEIRPSIRIIGSEPEGAKRYAVSRSAGKPMWLDNVWPTIADGTRTDHADPENFKIIEQLVDDLVSVSDSSIREAMWTMLSEAKIVAEPSSSMGVAAALDRSLNVRPGDRVCFVISGGNNDLSLIADIIEKHK
jgi:threonine dehydratase